MDRDQLREHLSNKPLMTVIEQRAAIRKARRDLLEARERFQDAGVSYDKTRLTEKLSEYKRISDTYGNLIQDAWGVRWQDEAVIARYMDSDIDDLPDAAF